MTSGHKCHTCSLLLHGIHYHTGRDVFTNNPYISPFFQIGITRVCLSEVSRHTHNIMRVSETLIILYEEWKKGTTL